MMTTSGLGMLTSGDRSPHASSGVAIILPGLCFWGDFVEGRGRSRSVTCRGPAVLGTGGFHASVKFLNEIRHEILRWPFLPLQGKKFVQLGLGDGLFHGTAEGRIHEKIGCAGEFPAGNHHRGATLLRISPVSVKSCRTSSLDRVRPFGNCRMLRAAGPGTRVPNLRTLPAFRQGFPGK